MDVHASRLFFTFEAFELVFLLGSFEFFAPLNNFELLKVKDFTVEENGQTPHGRIFGANFILLLDELVEGA